WEFVRTGLDLKHQPGSAEIHVALIKGRAASRSVEPIDILVIPWGDEHPILARRRTVPGLERTQLIAAVGPNVSPGRDRRRARRTLKAHEPLGQGGAVWVGHLAVYGVKAAAAPNGAEEKQQPCRGYETHPFR